MRRVTSLLACGAVASALVILTSFLPAGLASATTKSSKSPAAVSAAHCASNRAAGRITFVSPFDYDASAGIIDVFAAKSLGYFSDLCLNVAITVPSPTLSPYTLVSSGRGTVSGSGSAADFLLQTASESNLTAVATFADTSDYTLLTRGSISNLKHLAGQTLGYHSTLPVVLSEMLERAGVDVKKVHFVNDTSYDPALLIHGSFDALQAYQSNEPLELEAEGYRLGTAFREWLPSSFGVQGTFNVQFMNSTFVKLHPGAAADFLRAELKATAYCIAHQAKCVSIEEQAATAAKSYVDHAHDLAEWSFESGLIERHGLSGVGIGVQTMPEWQPEATAVLHSGLIKTAPDLAKVEDTKLVASLYRGTTLIWP